MSDTTSFSNDLSRVLLPVAGFSAANDSLYGSKAANYNQWLSAQKTAVDHGYQKLTEFVIPGKGHMPLPDEVINYFYALLTEEKKE